MNDEFNRAGYEDWLHHAGKKDPLAAHEARDRAEAEALAKIEADKQAAYMRMRYNDDEL